MLAAFCWEISTSHTPWKECFDQYSLKPLALILFHIHCTSQFCFVSTAKNKIKRKKSQRCKLNPFSKTIFLESLDNQEYRSEHWKRSEWCRHIFSATLSYLPYDQSVFGLTKKWQAKGDEDVMELRCLRRKLNKSYKMFTLSDQT